MEISFEERWHTDTSAALTVKTLQLKKSRKTRKRLKILYKNNCNLGIEWVSSWCFCAGKKNLRRGKRCECISRLSPLIPPLATLYYLSHFLRPVIRYTSLTRVDASSWHCRNNRAEAEGAIEYFLPSSSKKEKPKLMKSLFLCLDHVTP